MRATLQTACAVTIALAGLVACRSGSNANSDSANGAVGNAPAGAPATNTVTPQPANGAAGGATASADTTANAAAAGSVNLGSLGDTAILAKADAGDSTEVAVAKYMRLNSKNPAVKSYADELERDHARGIGQVEKTASSLKIKMQMPPGDTTVQGAQHALDHLKSLNGNDRDTAFVNHEIQDHQHDIAETQQMANMATAPQVKALLNKELPELQKHLKDAQTLQTKLQNGSGNTAAKK